MRYICSICGYVYDEEKEGVPFSGLPDTWVCPPVPGGKISVRTGTAARDSVRTGDPRPIQGDKRSR